MDKRTAQAGGETAVSGNLAAKLIPRAMNKPKYPAKTQLRWWLLVIQRHGMHVAWLVTFAASYHWWPWPWAAWPLLLLIIQTFGTWGAIAEGRDTYLRARAEWNDNQDLLEDAVRAPGDDRAYDRFSEAEGA